MVSEYMSMTGEGSMSLDLDLTSLIFVLFQLRMNLPGRWEEVMAPILVTDSDMEDQWTFKKVELQQVYFIFIKFRERNSPVFQSCTDILLSVLVVFF